MVSSEKEVEITLPIRRRVDEYTLCIRRKAKPPSLKDESMPLICQSFTQPIQEWDFGSMEKSSDIVLSTTISNVRKKIREQSDAATVRENENKDPSSSNSDKLETDTTSKLSKTQQKKLRRQARQLLEEKGVSTDDLSKVGGEAVVNKWKKTHVPSGGLSKVKLTGDMKDLAQAEAMNHVMIDSNTKKKRPPRPVIPSVEEQTKKDVQDVANYDPRTEKQKRRDARREQLQGAKEFYKFGSSKITRVMSQMGKTVSKAIKEEANLETDESKKKIFEEMVQSTQLFGSGGMSKKQKEAGLERMRQIAPGVAGDMERLMFAPSDSTPKQRDSSKTQK